MYPTTFSNRPIRDGFEELFLVLINRGHSADLNFLCGSGAGVGLRSVSAEISDDSDIQRGKLRKGLREFVDHYRGDDDHGIRVADEEHSGSPYAEVSIATFGFVSPLISHILSQGRLNAIRGLLRAVDTKHDPGILEDVIINLDDDADYEGVEHGTASEMVAAILKHCKHRAKEGGSLVEEIKSVLLVFQSHWAESCRRFARENKTGAQIIVEEEKRIAMEYQVLSWEVKVSKY